MTPEDLPYFGELQKIRASLEKGANNYPYNGCSHASRVVNLITGIREVAGSFTFKYCYGSPTDIIHEEWHAWNYDQERGLYIDLSADQFGDFPKIFITKRPKRSVYQESRQRTAEQLNDRIEIKNILNSLH